MNLTLSKEKSQPVTIKKPAFTLGQSNAQSNDTRSKQEPINWI